MSSYFAPALSKLILFDLTGTTMIEKKKEARFYASAAATVFKEEDVDGLRDSNLHPPKFLRQTISPARCRETAG